MMEKGTPSPEAGLRRAARRIHAGARARAHQPPRLRPGMAVRQGHGGRRDAPGWEDHFPAPAPLRASRAGRPQRAAALAVLRGRAPRGARSLPPRDAGQRISPPVSERPRRRRDRHVVFRRDPGRPRVGALHQAAPRHRRCRGVRHRIVGGPVVARDRYCAPGTGEEACLIQAVDYLTAEARKRGQVIVASVDCEPTSAAPRRACAVPEPKYRACKSPQKD